MSDPIRDQLGAYLDGELREPARQAVQAHLETCPACRAELAELRRLSETLRQAPLPAQLPSAGRFADQVSSRLPPRPVEPASFPMSRTGWLIPLGLLAAMLAIQAGTLVSMIIPLAANGGLFGQAGAWLAGGPQHTLWFSAASTLLGGDPVSSLRLANDLAVVLQQWIVPLLLHLTAAAAYLAWLAVWWTKYRAAQVEAQALVPQA